MGLTKWVFEDYKVFEDDEGELLRFENNVGMVLGYVFNRNKQLSKELNNGANPLADGWEDGNGNKLDLIGWYIED